MKTKWDEIKILSDRVAKGDVEPLISLLRALPKECIAPNSDNDEVLEGLIYLLCTGDESTIKSRDKAWDTLHEWADKYTEEWGIKG